MNAFQFGQMVKAALDPAAGVPALNQKKAADPRAMMATGESGAAHPLNAINAANQTMKHYGKAYNQGNQQSVQNYANQYQSLMQGASAANKQMGGPAIPVRPLPSTIAPASPSAPVSPPTTGQTSPPVAQPPRGLGLAARR